MKLLAVLLALCLAGVPAGAEEFQTARLEEMEGFSTYTEANHVDVVVRSGDQPYAGQVELADGEMAVFLDFIQKADEGMTLLRLTLSLTSYDYVAASELTITVGQTDYTFPLFPEVTEYDMTYFEDYVICLTDESLPMVKAMARSKENIFPFRLTGVREVEGSITLPLDRVADLYDTYVDLGGLRQRLDLCREQWPVIIQPHGQ